MKIQYNQHQKLACKIKTEDLIYLKATNLTMTCLMKKLDDKCMGPFKVIAKKGSFSYQLHLPTI